MKAAATAIVHAAEHESTEMRNGSPRNARDQSARTAERTSSTWPVTLTLSKR
jgi:hypothetical protein